VIRRLNLRLVAACDLKKLALVARTWKLLTILNAMVRTAWTANGELVPA
jgi:hypothetical protein